MSEPQTRLHRHRPLFTYGRKQVKRCRNKAGNKTSQMLTCGRGKNPSRQDLQFSEWTAKMRLVKYTFDITVQHTCTNYITRHCIHEKKLLRILPFLYCKTINKWCRRRESNPHEGSPHAILSRARLPIPPLRHITELYYHKCRVGARPTGNSF